VPNDEENNVVESLCQILILYLKKCGRQTKLSVMGIFDAIMGF